MQVNALTLILAEIKGISDRLVNDMFLLIYKYYQTENCALPLH